MTVLPLSQRPTTTTEHEPRAPQGSTASRALTLHVYDSSKAFRVMGEWQEFEATLPAPPLMASAAWTSAWLRHYSDLIPHRFLVGRRSGEMKAVCLLTEGVGQYDGPFRIRTRHLGTAGEAERDSVCVEYNSILAADSDRPEFVDLLFGELHSDRSWDELRFDGFESTELQHCLAAHQPAHTRSVPSYYFNLKAARESGDVLAHLGYSTRKTLRKNLRSYGHLQTEWAETTAHAHDILDDLIRLHQVRWEQCGEAGAYASSRFQAFHRDLIDRLLPEGRIALFRVSHERDIVGCVQLFIDRNRALCYQGGSAPYNGKLSPGVVVDYLCIEECLARNLDAYDFLGGESHHKRRLTTDCHTLVWACYRRPRLRFALTNLARKMFPRKFRRKQC